MTCDHTTWAGLGTFIGCTLRDSAPGEERRIPDFAHCPRCGETFSLDAADAAAARARVDQRVAQAREDGTLIEGRRVGFGPGGLIDLGPHTL